MAAQIILWECCTCAKSAFGVVSHIRKVEIKPTSSSGMVEEECELNRKFKDSDKHELSFLCSWGFWGEVEVSLAGRKPRKDVFYYMEAENY